MTIDICSGKRHSITIYSLIVVAIYMEYGVVPVRCVVPAAAGQQQQQQLGGSKQHEDR
jgi:hypothetical protein